MSELLAWDSSLVTIDSNEVTLDGLSKFPNKSLLSGLFGTDWMRFDEDANIGTSYYPLRLDYDAGGARQMIISLDGDTRVTNLMVMGSAR